MTATLRDMRDAGTPLPEFIILDTSLLLEVSLQSKPVAVSFLNRLAYAALNGNALILVPLLVIEECYYKLIQIQYENAGYNAKNKMNWHYDGYKAHPHEISQYWHALNAFEQAVLNLPAVITGPDDLIVSSVSAIIPLHQHMLQNIRDFWLLPKDAYIVAEAQRLGISDLATLDSDWDRLNGFTVYRPL